MKLPNGYGSVYKLSGRRRNPYIARKTVGWEVDEEKKTAKQQYITIGYYPTKAAALIALANFNENPYNIETDKITFAEVYEKWSEEHFVKIVPNAQRTWKSAFTHSKPLHNMRMKDIRTVHLEQAIKNADVGSATKGRMKSLYNMIYRFAMKHEICDKDYAALCDSVKKGKPQIVRLPFTATEMQQLWNNLNYPFVDMVLIGIYTGWRPQELAILKVADIDLAARTMFGGLKTDAGRNRCVPIHPKIFDLVQQNYHHATAIGSDYLFNDADGQQGTHLTYDKYRGRFNKINARFGMDHRPHDTRHTFITLAKTAAMNEYILKLIVGHAIEDITEKVYTHRTIEQLAEEMAKIE